VASVNEELRQLAVSHQIGLTRLSSGVAEEVKRLLRKVEADLVAQILDKDPTSDSGLWSVTRMRELLRQIRLINADNIAEVGSHMRRALSDAAEYETEYQAKALQKKLPVRWSLNMPSTKTLESLVTRSPMAGRLLEDWVSGLEAGRLDRVKTALQLGLSEGETIDQIVRRIRGTRAANFEDGVLAISRRSAETMVRTAVNGVTTNARELLYKENDDLIKGVQWVSTLDTRTSPICRDRDGEVYPPNEGPRPPAHPNCRSTTVPVTKSWDELGVDAEEIGESERASMDGQVAEKLTYAEWLRKQSAAVQDEALGPTRAALYRRGGVALDRFVDQTGSLYTLDQLRRREAAAFRRI
jgi:SPP1 gp7 family putative phage head morphogenesis protein